MLKLIYKDLLLVKKQLVTFFAILLFYYITGLIGITVTIASDTSIAPGEYGFDLLAICIGFMCAFTVTNLFDEMIRNDENKKWAYFISSSPVSAEGAVREKYLCWILLLCVGLFVAYLFDTIGSVITGGLASGLFPGFYLAILVFTWVKAVELPFIFRFGAAKGNNIRFGTIGAVMVLAAVYGLFGDLSPFGDIEQIISNVTAFIINGGESKEGIVISVMFPYAAAFMLYISYRLSVRLFREGIQEYEE